MEWIWLGIVAIALAVEFVTYEFVSIWFVPGALVGCLLAVFDVMLPIQIAVAVVVSMGCLFAFRPLAMRAFKKTIATNADALVGKQVKLIEGITEDKKGKVKFGDVVWAAVSDTQIEQGCMVEVVEISGNKLLVKEVK